MHTATTASVRCRALPPTDRVTPPRAAPSAPETLEYDSRSINRTVLGGRVLSAQLRETAAQLADVLWRRHTVYRDRSGGVVIRGEHVQRWISLAPSGRRDEILLRAGRILDGGTTAPARSEAVVPLHSDTGELAAACRRLLAEVAVDAAPPAPAAPGRTKRSRKPKRSSGREGKRMSLASWMILACVVGVVALYAYGAATTGTR